MPRKQPLPPTDCGPLLKPLTPATRRKVARKYVHHLTTAESAVAVTSIEAYRAAHGRAMKSGRPRRRA